ncbi:MAG: OmpH family outer membrane protein [Pacificimonas sp.]|jgi:Skp family chaperone for outer membrane proteins|nr:OmpH family outer membrane protein [Pacificimonas sp.]
MTNFKTSMKAAALGVAALGATASFAQAQTVGVLDAQGAIRGSQAFQTAIQQLQTQYAAQIQQSQTREQQLTQELQTAAQALQTAAQQPNADQNALRQQQAQLQQRQQAAQQELGTLREPIARAESYIIEQVQVQLDAAVRAAMTATGTQLVLRPEAVVLALNPAAANITDDTITQLNQRLQAVSITPPEGWQQGQTLAAARQAAQPQQQ